MVRRKTPWITASVLVVLLLMLHSHCPLTASRGNPQSSGKPTSVENSLSEGSTRSSVPSPARVHSRQVKGFTENRGQVVDTDGQTRPEIKYVADVDGARVFFTLRGTHYVYARRVPESRSISEATGEPIIDNNEHGVRSRELRTEICRLSMELVGVNPAVRIIAEDELQGGNNYYLAHCPDGILGVREYRKITYVGVYDHIDLEYLSISGRLKYTFIVHPGGQVDDIRLRYSGAESIEISPGGRLRILSSFGGLEEEVPFTYQKQNINPGRIERVGVTARFRKIDSEVGFMVDEYDHTKILVIDPWARYFGSVDNERAWDLEVDSNGDVLITGLSGPDFPVDNPSTYVGGGDAFITKFDTAGTVKWSTFFGGTGLEEGHGIGINQAGDIAITGWTGSPDLPNAASSSLSGPTDSFVARFNSDGTLQWSTYVGGSDREESNGVGIASGGSVIIAGWTRSPDLPHPGSTSYSGYEDVFVAGISPSGTIQWTHYLSGMWEEDAYDLAMDTGGNVIITGMTGSPDFPATNSNHSDRDAFLVKLSGSGTQLWGLYIGGNGDDRGLSVAVDAIGCIFLTGFTRSHDFPVTMTAHSGGIDAFVMKYSASGTLEWGRFFGGMGWDYGVGIAVDGAGNIAVKGETQSTNLPVTNSSTCKGAFDNFVTKLDGNGNILWATYYGGSGDEHFIPLFGGPGGGCGVDANGNISITGRTSSTDLPITISSSYGGGPFDVFIASFDCDGELSSIPPPAPTELTASVESPTRVRLNWQDNSENEAVFDIQSCHPGKTWYDLQTVPKNSDSCLAANLAPLTEHSFRVRAVNSRYKSDWSNVATVTTGAFDPPLNLTATAHSSVEISLAWVGSTDGEDGYIMERMKTGGSWNIIDSVDRASEYYMAGNLEHSTSYHFRIYAYAGYIRTAYSNIAQATTLLYLAAPTNLNGTLMTESQVVLSWEDKADGESGYEIEHNQENQGWKMLDTTVADATSYDARGLTPNTTNAFRIRAIGPNAASGYSNVCSIRTRMKPAAPYNLLASAVDHTSVRVTWERGSENEDGYEVWRRVPEGDWEFLTTAGPGEENILDENLEMTTTYWYRVRAENELGVSDWSNEDSATTFDVPIPGDPFGLQAEAVGPTSVTLTWIPASPNYAESFDIEMSLTDSEDDFERIPAIVGGNEDTYSVSGLDQQITYYFRIRAVNHSGESEYSNLASATTLKSDDPVQPRNVSARALGRNHIEITWEMPAVSNEEGFELQRSRTPVEEEFLPVSRQPEQGARQHIDSGLTAETRYYYRLRSFNSYGHSPWTEPVSATTLNIDIDPALRAIMDEKRAVITAVEGIIPDGSEQLSLLRSLLGDYLRGYDESAARELISEWMDTGADDPGRATEAMKRLTIFEKLLQDSWGDEDVSPVIPGTQDIAEQAARAPAFTCKDLVALAIAWKDECAFLGSGGRFLTSAMEDVVLSHTDNLALLLTLMGSNHAAEVSALSNAIVRGRGEVPGLSVPLLLSMKDYWQERFLAMNHIPAVNPLITLFSGRTSQYDVSGSLVDAEKNRDTVLAILRAVADTFTLGFGDYSRICSGLDAAFSICQTAGNPLDVFLNKLAVLRPRLIENMHDALHAGNVPVERFLYLTSTDAIPGIETLPSALWNAGNAIFDPVNCVIQQDERGNHSSAPLASPLRKATGMIGSDRGTAPAVYCSSEGRSPDMNDAIARDTNMLREMRERVIQQDIHFIDMYYDSLRMSGDEMTAEMTASLCPLLGIAPGDVLGKTDVCTHYYAILARVQRMKMRRAVLSVALADYLLAPSEEKKGNLVTEIDSIIDPMNDVMTDLSTFTDDVVDLIRMPALTLDDVAIVRASASGSDRWRIRFTVENVGCGGADSAAASIDIITPGVTMLSQGNVSIGILRPDETYRDSIEISALQNLSYIIFSTILKSGQRSFYERRFLSIPTVTDCDEGAAHAPCCTLDQNYPNPFSSSTTVRFMIPHAMTVSMVITDIYGRTVKRIVDDQWYGSGIYAIEMDAHDMPSGVYFYRLETPSAVLLEKMLVLRR